MLPSAQRLMRRLGTTSGPDEGTGPSGAYDAATGQHCRWITPRDVLKHHAHQPWTREEAWMPTQREFRETDATQPLRPTVGSTLRDYQLLAVAASLAPDATSSATSFRSGLHEIRCGGGKTFVGGELLRMAYPCASVVITQHTVSVDQWVAHLTSVVGVPVVHTLTTLKASGWKLHQPLPHVVVLTYQTLVRAATLLENDRDVTTDAPTLLVWLLHCLSFGVLVLDEVHLAAADHFRAACRLRAGVVYGLSGSLVREDAHLTRLANLIGPVLFRHLSTQKVTYEIVRVPVSDEVRATLATLSRRGAVDHAVRALQPAKIAAVQRILTRLSDRRVVLFCDSRQASEVLAKHLECHLMNGNVSHEARSEILVSFAAAEAGVIVSTRVCDAAVDFPPGCVVVQVHHSSGSRQQEVQRCGRGSRDTSGLSHVIHVVNRDTDEEGFVSRRVEYMRGVVGSLELNVSDDEGIVSDVDHHPFRCITTVNLAPVKPSRRRQSMSSSTRRLFKRTRGASSTTDEGNDNDNHATEDVE